MIPTPTRPLPTATLVVVALLLYVAPLFLGLPLLDPDEGLHAAISQEMVERGDYVTPRFLGEPFLDKPVLFFWIQAAGLRVFGSHESVIRGIGLALALCGALTTLLLGRRLFGAAAGTTAGVVHATMLLPAALGQAAVHDIALVPWVTLAVLAFWDARFARTDGGALAFGALGGLWLGLAVLTKGLVGVAIAGIAVSAWLLWTWALRPRLVLAGLVALVVAAAVATPWYLAMERASPGYLHYFIVERHLLGFATGTQPHGDRPWWYYLPVVAVGGLPWVAWIRRAPRRADPEDRAAEARRLAWCWLAGGLLFLSAAGSKLVTYVLPIFPPLAVLVADSLSRAVEDRERAAIVPRLLSGAAMALLLPALLVVKRTRFGVTSGDVAGWTAAGALAVAWLTVGLSRTGTRRTLLWTVTLTVASVWVALLLVVPPVARVLSAHDLAVLLNRRGQFPDRLWIVEERVGSVVFYLEPALRRGLTPERVEKVGMDRVVGMRQAAPGTLIAIPAERLGRVARRIDLAGVPYEDSGAHRIYTAEALVSAMRRAGPQRR